MRPSGHSFVYTSFRLVTFALDATLMAAKDLPELIMLKRLIHEGGRHIEVRTHCSMGMDGRQFPVCSLTMGSPSLEVPARGFFGGIHGLERTGTQVILSFL